MEIFLELDHASKAVQLCRSRDEKLMKMQWHELQSLVSIAMCVDAHNFAPAFVAACKSIEKTLDPISIFIL